MTSPNWNGTIGRITSTYPNGHLIIPGQLSNARKHSYSIDTLLSTNTPQIPITTLCIKHINYTTVTEQLTYSEREQHTSISNQLVLSNMNPFTTTRCILVSVLPPPVPVTSVQGVLAKQAQLACDITPMERDDVVFMVLWFRDGHGEPLYR